MAKEEAKPGGAAAPGAEAAKAPLFSKAGLMVLAGAVVVSGGGTAAFFSMKGGGGPQAPVEAHEPEPETPHEAPVPGAHHWANNTVEIGTLQGKYRDTGSARRAYSVSVVLEVRTDEEPQAGGGGEGHGGGGGGNKKLNRELQEKDAERKKQVEAQIAWIKDKIYDIFRGKGPEDFATNEMVEQVKQQIKRAVNDEKFPKDPAVVAVLFPEQGF